MHWISYLFIDFILDFKEVNQTLKYKICLYEIGKIKFIQKIYDNSYTVLEYKNIN